MHLFNRDNIYIFSFRILPVERNRRDQDRLGVEWEESGRDFFYSIMDMECQYFCESESKLLECSDSGGWDRI